MLNTKQPNFYPHSATVQLCGPITDELVIQCVQDIDELVQQYFYDQIELHIDSPGGSASSLLYLIEALDNWEQNHAIRVVTFAMTNAASAAAFMLSLGTERRAAASSRLHYHKARVEGKTGSAFTASAMSSHSQQLVELDVRMLKRLVERVEQIDTASWLDHLKNQSNPVADLGLNEQKFCDRLFNGHGDSSTVDDGTRLNERVALLLKSDSNEIFKTRLFTLFENLLDMDVSISPQIAKSLGLIDIVGRRDPFPLKLRQRSISKNGPGRKFKPGFVDASLRIPEWRAIYPSGVPELSLCRHTLILGETGSGKTASGILPVVRAGVGAMTQKRKANRIGCLLIVDPKRDIGPVLQETDGLEIRRLTLTSKEQACERVRLNLMVNTPIDMSACDLRSSAEEIMRQAASLSFAHPMRGMEGKGGGSRLIDRFWDNLGSEVGLIFLELALILLNRFEGVNAGTCLSLYRSDTAEVVRTFLELRDADKNVLVLAKHLRSAWGAFDQFENLPDIVNPLFSVPQCTDDRAQLQLKNWAGRQKRFAATFTQDDRFFESAMASSFGCFQEFCSTDIEDSLYFGCEPITKRMSECFDVAACVSPSLEKPQVLLLQPDLTRLGSGLLTRAFKAQFFQAVLRDPIRREPRTDPIPLVGYIADEFHRFVTSDPLHGEQSFLDTCRSFGAFCVLACQSISSLEHGLREIGSGESTDSSIDVLVNNTATKLQFRSTDPKTQTTLCKIVPHCKWGSLFDARPISSLRTGECYAMLADGKVARKKMGWVNHKSLSTKPKSDRT